jgi:hypothetical protein
MAVRLRDLVEDLVECPPGVSRDGVRVAAAGRRPVDQRAAQADGVRPGGQVTGHLGRGDPPDTTARSPGSGSRSARR